MNEEISKLYDFQIWSSKGSLTDSNIPFWPINKTT